MKAYTDARPTAGQNKFKPKKAAKKQNAQHRTLSPITLRC